MSFRTYIIDTNVVVAGLISADVESPACRILDAMLDGSLAFLLSPALLGEYRHVLLRSRVAKLHGLDRGAIDDLLAHLTANAIWRDPTSSPATPPDPGDRHLWSLLAFQPHAVLVTGDRLLLDNPPEEGAVMTPGECVAKGTTPDGTDEA